MSYSESSSVQFSCSVVSDSLRPHESQHARPPCPSPTPGVYSNPCSSSRWCHPAISSSVVPFSSCPQSLPASGSSPMSQLFHEGTKVLRPLNIRDLTGICRQEWPADLIATFAWLNKSPRPAVFLRPEETRQRLLYINLFYRQFQRKSLDAYLPRQDGNPSGAQDIDQTDPRSFQG